MAFKKDDVIIIEPSEIFVGLSGARILVVSCRSLSADRY